MAKQCIGLNPAQRQPNAHYTNGAPALKGFGENKPPRPEAASKREREHPTYTQACGPEIQSNSARNRRFPHNSCKTLAKQMHKTIGKTAKIQHSHHTNSWKNHRKKARNSAHLPHNGMFFVHPMKPMLSPIKPMFLTLMCLFLIMRPDLNEMELMPQTIQTMFGSTSSTDSVSERLRRWTRNPLGSARRGSNPLAVVSLCMNP